MFQTTTLFDNCEPWPDVLSGAADFTAAAKPPFSDPITFFRRTLATHGLKVLLGTVCRRLSDADRCVSAIIGLHSKYGCGKTHGLTAAMHVVQSGRLYPKSVAGFVDAALVPCISVRVRLVDGEARNDFPGDSFLPRPGDEPTLILLDGLAVLWRRDAQACRDFLNALFPAVASTPYTALCYTLGSANDDPARDPYRHENQELAAAIEGHRSRFSVLHVTPLEPSEMAAALRRSLFAAIDEAASEPYPLTPAAFALLSAKVARANTCQSFRGMQRVVAHTIRNLWRERPAGVQRIDVCHLDFTTEIERLAYYFWERRGRPEGSSEEDWLRAEREFRES